MIICGYPGLGKSALSKRNKKVVDLDSTLFYNRDERPGDWYEYYCNIAISLSNQGYDVFVSTHKIVRVTLQKRNIPVFAIIPSLGLYEEWTEKLRQRYFATKLDADKRAYIRCKNDFDYDLGDIRNSCNNTYTIRTMSYNLNAILNIMHRQFEEK